MSLRAHRDLPRRAPTPADLLLLACLVGLALWLPFQGQPAASPGQLWVHAAEGSRLLDSRIDGDYPIAGPAGETLLRIRNGSVWIAAAPCRLEVCQRMGPIRNGKGSLVCVPNRVVVRFAAPPVDVDGVTR